MTIKVKTGEVAVDQEYYWLSMETCPRSAKVQLLNSGGVAVYGHYHGETHWRGWAPLPKKPLSEAGSQSDVEE